MGHVMTAVEETFVVEGPLIEIVLPLCIVAIMIAMGMTLTGDDFRRVLSKPKTVGIGLVCQLILLPVIGFLIAWIFPLEAVFAVSIVLLSAAPGGTTSNLIVHSSNGDRALSVTLTSLSNTVVWITMPILLTLAYSTFDLGQESVSLPLGELIAQIAGLTIVPILIGMGLRRWKPELCARLQEPSKIFAALFLTVVVFALVIDNWSVVADNAPKFGPAFIALNIVALTIGYGVAKALGVENHQASTIGIETGLQNTTLALTVAISVLGNSEMAIIPGLYGVWMLFSGFVFAYLTRGDRESATSAALT